MKEPLLLWDEVRVPGVESPPLNLRVGQGDCVLLCAADARETALLTETALGVTPPQSGTARLFGRDLFTLPEAERAGLLARAGFACAEGGLVANLKVWENLLLPSLYHGRLAAAEAEIEERVLALLKSAGEGPEWAEHYLPAAADALGPYEIRLAGLTRAWLMTPELLVAESLFARQDRHAVAKLTAALAWMRRERPEMGVLCLHHGSAEAAHLDLRALPNVTIMTMKGAGDALSEEH